MKNIVMWLRRKSERKLLAHYAKNVYKAGEKYEISDEDLMKLLRLCNVDDLHNMKRDFHELKFIVCSNLGKEKIVLTVKGRQEIKETENPVIRMTEEGFRLGRKYARLYGTFEIWCRENIWFLVFLGVVIGAIGVLTTIIIAIIKD